MNILTPIQTRVSKLLQDIEEGKAGLTETYEELKVLAEQLGGRKDKVVVDNPYELYTPEMMREQALFERATQEMTDGIVAYPDSVDFQSFMRSWQSRYRRLGAEDTAVREAVLNAWEAQHGGRSDDGEY